MPSCPKCHTSGSNWKFCSACKRYFCGKCAHKDMHWLVTNKCPFCGSLGKITAKQP